MRAKEGWGSGCAREWLFLREGRRAGINVGVLMLVELPGGSVSWLCEVLSRAVVWSRGRASICPALAWFDEKRWQKCKDLKCFKDITVLMRRVQQMGVGAGASNICEAKEGR